MDSLKDDEGAETFSMDSTKRRMITGPGSKEVRQIEQAKTVDANMQSYARSASNWSSLTSFAELAIKTNAEDRTGQGYFCKKAMTIVNGVHAVGTMVVNATTIFDYEELFVRIDKDSFAVTTIKANPKLNKQLADFQTKKNHHKIADDATGIVSRCKSRMADSKDLMLLANVLCDIRTNFMGVCFSLGSHHVEIRSVMTTSFEKAKILLSALQSSVAAAAPKERLDSLYSGADSISLTLVESKLFVRQESMQAEIVSFGPALKTAYDNAVGAVPFHAFLSSWTAPAKGEQLSVKQMTDVCEKFQAIDGSLIPELLLEKHKVAALEMLGAAALGIENVMTTDFDKRESVTVIELFEVVDNLQNNCWPAQPEDDGGEVDKEIDALTDFVTKAINMDTAMYGTKRAQGDLDLGKGDAETLKSELELAVAKSQDCHKEMDQINAQLEAADDGPDKELFTPWARAAEKVMPIVEKLVKKHAEPLAESARVELGKQNGVLQNLNKKSKDWSKGVSKEDKFDTIEKLAPTTILKEGGVHYKLNKELAVRDFTKQSFETVCQAWPLAGGEKVLEAAKKEAPSPTKKKPSAAEQARLAGQEGILAKTRQIRKEAIGHDVEGSIIDTLCGGESLEVKKAELATPRQTRAKEGIVEKEALHHLVLAQMEAVVNAPTKTPPSEEPAGAQGQE